MKQTAVEFIEQHLFLDDNWRRIFQQAKEMEKQQIIEFSNYCVELQYESFQTGKDINAESMEELLKIFKNK